MFLLLINHGEGLVNKFFGAHARLSRSLEDRLLLGFEINHHCIAPTGVGELQGCRHYSQSSVFRPAMPSMNLFEGAVEIELLLGEQGQGGVVAAALGFSDLGAEVADAALDGALLNLLQGAFD